MRPNNILCLLPEQIFVTVVCQQECQCALGFFQRGELTFPNKGIRTFPATVRDITFPFWKAGSFLLQFGKLLFQRKVFFDIFLPHYVSQVEEVYKTGIRSRAKLLQELLGAGRPCDQIYVYESNRDQG